MKTMSKTMKVSVLTIALATAATSVYAVNTWQDSDHETFSADAIQLDAIQAMNIATQNTSGQVLEVELEHDDGQMLYEVEVATNQGITELEINAMTGDIISTENEKLRKHDKKDLAAMTQAKLTMAQAIDAAKTMQAATIIAVEFDQGRDNSLYEFEIAQQKTVYELELDANTGELVKLEKDERECKGKKKHRK